MDIEIRFKGNMKVGHQGVSIDAGDKFLTVSYLLPGGSEHGYLYPLVDIDFISYTLTQEENEND